MKPVSEVKLMDCMDYMRGFPDKFFELAVVDFPYGIKQDGRKNHTRGKGTGFAGSKSKGVVSAKDYRNNAKYDSSAPDVQYFNEVIRVSKNQIFWGANHFINRMPYNSSAWIVWDKMNGESDFADCELAWTSFNCAVRKFQFKWNGMLQGDMKNKEERIHPNQKPVALYVWILNEYAKPGDKILDPMTGSQNSRIAAYKLGFNYWGCENDPQHYQNGCARFEKSIAMPLFDSIEMPEQLKMF